MSGGAISHPSAHTLQRIESPGRRFDEVIDFRHHGYHLNLLILLGCELCYQIGVLFLHDVFDLRSWTCYKPGKQSKNTKQEITPRRARMSRCVGDNMAYGRLKTASLEAISGSPLAVC